MFDYYFIFEFLIFFIKDLNAALIGRLFLSEEKINSLINGMQQIAANRNILGRVLKYTKLAEGLVLKKISVPLGVLLVIFESRPEILPQVTFWLRKRTFLSKKNLLKNSFNRYVPCQFYPEMRFC